MQLSRRLFRSGRHKAAGPGRACRPKGQSKRRKHQGGSRQLPAPSLAEDWMKRSFVSCKYYDTEELLSKPAQIVSKVLNPTV